MDELDGELCWQLLSRHPVGRIGFVWDGRPHVLPVNHAVDGASVVLRTAPGTLLAALRDGQAVTFEVDHTDRALETGWSVVVEGSVMRVTDPYELARLHGLALHPWAPPERDLWLRVTASGITGRAISRRRTSPEGTLLPYMPPD